MMKIFGINACLGTLQRRPELVLKLCCENKPLFDAVVALADQKRVKVERIQVAATGPKNQSLVNESHLPKQNCWLECKDFVLPEDRQFWSVASSKKGANGNNERANVLILDQVQDVMNAGNILRTASFLGFKAVFLGEHNSFPFNGLLIEASSGEAWNIPIYRFKSMHTLLEKLKKMGYWTLATSPHAQTSLSKFEGFEKNALIIGNEGSGIRKNVLEQADVSLAIEKLGAGESINVASSFAIIAYELTRQHLRQN